jgi:hypothetical protein
MAITGIQSENQQMAVRTGNPLVMNTPQPASYSGSGITYLATDVVGDSRRSLIPICCGNPERPSRKVLRNNIAASARQRL